uniref:Root phototropism protein 3 n=1 Tax=Anthurium amnicola TaxID=1678845 RepID=A0A1D1XTD0_9ARAE
MWESESERGGGLVGAGGEYRDRQDGAGLKTDGFEHRGQSWYVATDVPSDLLIRVGDISFHLHKYPLLSRSGRLNRIIYESSREAEPNRLELDDIPGGAESFELAAKFCYGIAVDLTASNISGLRCAAEYMEMTEDLEEGNLIFKTEAFLSYVVLSSWRDSIVVLKSCECLSPWSENLQIVRRCSESIAWKACANPRAIRWPYTGRPPSRGAASPRNHLSSSGTGDSKDSSPSRGAAARAPVPADWWFEDVSILRIDHFVRVVTAIKVKGMRFELVGAAIMFYAAKWLPGLGKEVGSAGDDVPWGGGGGGLHLVVAGVGREPPSSTSQAREQRMMIESLISIIPPQKDSVSCSFLLRLLRLANMLTVAPALVTELEKRVGMQLEQAGLGDLLIPSYSKCETLYDVDLVRRLVEHFLVQEQTEPSSSSPGRDSSFSEAHGYDGGQRATAPNAKMRVARLLDSYLTEVSRDRNLSLTKFQVLAEALPETARTCDDGLYRAVDSYLKAHPTLTEHERKRLCRVMDCQKLSLDACMHAAQNERLPLRVVVQVLFSEQVKISNAIANSSLKDAGAGEGSVVGGGHYQPMVPSRKQLLEGTPQSFQEGWAAAKKDINTLKFELESMRAKYMELQGDMDNLQRQMDKMAVKPTKHQPSSSSSSAWTSGWKKLSKLTRIGVDGQEAGGASAAIGVGEQPTRKGPRRWRNSIS